jgi:polygalacturonase
MTMFDVRDYGAVGDGQTLDTKAIQAALDACRDAGGGEVRVPAGRYLTGTLRVHSYTTLTLTPGATLLGSTRIEDYTRDIRGKSGDQTGHHLIRIADATRVRITGGGTIDGQGPAFWDSEDTPREVGVPWRGYRLAWSPHDDRPSPMVDIADSDNVHIEDVTLTNSAGWALNMRLSRWVWVQGVNILNPLDGPNTDGIDINACQDVIISDCHIENGDDSIVAFTLPDTGPCERITVTNCILKTRCAAIKFYTGCAYPFRQITVSNCIVYDSERAFAVYLRNGAVLEDIVCSNIVMHGGTHPPNFGERPIHIDVRNPSIRRRGIHDAVTASEAEIASAPETPGSLRGLTLSDWVIRSTGRILVGGWADVPIENLRLSNILMQVSGPQDLSAFVNPTPSTGQWNHDIPHLRTVPAHVVVHGVKGLMMRDVEVVNASAEPLQGMHGLWLEHVTGERIDGFNCYPLQPGFEPVARR